MDWVNTIKECFDTGSVLYTGHARHEMKYEPFGEIREKEGYEAVSTSEVVEEYSHDKPYPSVLLFGMTQENRPLHIVCAYSTEEGKVIIVTVYHPDPKLWDNYRRRKK